MSKPRETVFDEIEVGRSFEPYRFTPTREDKALHGACTAAGVLRRADGAPVEAASGCSDEVVSPLMLNTFKAIRAAINMPDGVLHAREEITLHAPARVGEELMAVLTIKEKYLKNDKRFVVIDHLISRAADGEPVMLVERRLAWPR